MLVPPTLVVARHGVGTPNPGNIKMHGMPAAIPTVEIARRQAIGRRIVQAADYAELSQGQLAVKIGVNPGNLSRMIAGKRVLAHKLAVIARVCGVDVDWLTKGGSGGPIVADAPATRRGRKPNADRLVRRLTLAEGADEMAAAREVWCLPPAIASRFLGSAVRASGLRTAAKRTDHALLVVVPG